MSRPNAHNLHSGTTRGHDPLERLVVRYVRRRRDLIAEVPTEERRFAAISLAVVAKVKPNFAGVQSIVVTADDDSIVRLSAAIAERVGRSPGVSQLALRADTDARREESLIAKHPDILVTTPTRLIDHIRRDGINLSGVSAVAIDVPADKGIEQFSADLHFIYAKFERRPATIALVRDLGREFDTLEDLLRRPTTLADSRWASPESRFSIPTPQERTMKDLPFDPEKLKDRIDEISKSIHHDEDPVELTQYRKFARRHTTIFNRGYVLAYLLKQAIEGGEPRAPRQNRQADPDKQSVFVSIGRSKRVRSRDLITFFTSANGIGQDDIGQVKVLDNYSFVEVASNKAQAAVDELNGQELRGRKLTVNFARRK